MRPTSSRSSNSPLTPSAPTQSRRTGSRRAPARTAESRPAELGASRAARWPRRAGPGAPGPDAPGQGRSRPWAAAQAALPTVAAARAVQAHLVAGPGAAQVARSAAVFARRWAVLVGLVLVVVIILAIALRSRPPALYWQGEPMAGRLPRPCRGAGRHAIGGLGGRGSALVGQPLLLQLVEQLRTTTWHRTCAAVPSCCPGRRRPPPGSPTSSPARRPVRASWFRWAARFPPDATSGLHRGEVLRRPDGAAAPKGTGGLALPAVPRQRAGWAGVLSAPPLGLRPAPVGDLIGDWGQTYRLVAFGEVSHLSSHLDPSALRDAVSPPGSAYATARTSGGRPLATLLLPMKGQALVVAELALGPGEAAGAVPSEAAANGAGPAQHRPASDRGARRRDGCDFRRRLRPRARD